MITIVDYGMGNLRSVQKALEKLGHPAEVTSHPETVARAAKLILPGVGAFGAAMEHLNRTGSGSRTLADGVKAVAGAGRPVLGICLGMQLFLSASEEMGAHRGLDLLPGRVVRFDFSGRAPEEQLKIPHMGWNELRFPRPSPLFAGLEDGASVYFVHSYHCVPREDAVSAATCRHGIEFCAALSHGNLFATQFHPEKSGSAGLRVLDNFARL